MNIAIIVAGGKGTRMGIKDKPKQFLDIYEKPIIIHTLEVFDKHQEIDYICIVGLEEWHDDIKTWIKEFQIKKVKWIVKEGNTRQKSVFNGLNALKYETNPEDIVLIHDAARPLINNRIISENIKAAKEYGCVCTVLPSTDTIIKSIDNKTIDSIPLRNELYLAQTPQSFKYSIIWNAHNNADEEILKTATDDCKLVLAYGNDIHLVNGDKFNFKITTVEDILFLKSIIELRELEIK